MPTIAQIQQAGIVAIVRGVGPATIVPTARALLAGGVTMMEVAFSHRDRQSLLDTVRAMEAVRDALGDKIALGAGTVLTPRQAADAGAAGAGYIISPNVDRRVIERTRELGLLSIPGALTPTEIADAHHAGADIVKLFPAGLWGPGYIKAVRAPLGHIPMMAVGGVEPDNVADFLATGCCGVGVGGSLVDLKAVAAGDFEKITAAARRFVRAVESARAR